MGESMETMREKHPRTELLYIVARTDPQVYASLRRAFVTVADVEVILDRRRGERRQSEVPPRRNLRRGDRRYLNVTRNLRDLGWVVTEPRTAAVQSGS